MIDPALAQTQLQPLPDATTDPAKTPAREPSSPLARTLGGLNWLSVAFLLAGTVGLAVVCTTAGYLAGRSQGDQDLKAARTAIAATEEEKAGLLEKNAALQASIGMFEQIRSEANVTHERTVQHLPAPVRNRRVVPASGHTVAAIGSAPPAADARPIEFSSLSLAAFLEKTRDASHEGQPKLIARYVGTRFEWVGYVSSVSTPKNEQDSVVVDLGPNDHAFQSGSTVRCLFTAGAHDEMLENLKLRRRILISGVLTDEGQLENCHLLMTMTPADNSSAPPSSPKPKDARPKAKPKGNTDLLQTNDAGSP